MKSIAVVRADSNSKVHTTLLDLRRYGRMVFAEQPKMITPEYADDILTSVLKCPLKNNCSAAAVVILKTSPSVAIGKLSKIHPPAHVVIVSSKHDIYDELMQNIEVFPDFEIRKEQLDQQAQTHEVLASY
ncbi:MAG: DUF356 domain-containing protein [Nitrospirae bacterium]|nr:DUF356 domain-containing protein [Nitrospirota bacterium]